MIEVYLRTFYPTFPSKFHDDELLYRGENRKEAIACIEAQTIEDNQLLMWDELPITPPKPRKSPPKG